MARRWMLDEIPAMATENSQNKTLVRLDEGGYSDYVPMLWRGDGKYTRSSIEDTMTDYNNSAWAAVDLDIFDPLEELLPKATSRGIKVHAWINVNRRVAGTAARLDDPSQAGNWHHDLWYNGDGTGEIANALDGPLTWGILDGAGINGGWSAYIISIMKEMMDNYPTLSGLFLDFLRTGGLGAGQGYYGQPFLDETTATVSSGNYFLPNVNAQSDDWNLWVDWVEERVTGPIVDAIKAYRDANHPAMEISIWGITTDEDGTRPTGTTGTSWTDRQSQGSYVTKWAQEGRCDFVYQGWYGDDINWTDILAQDTTDGIETKIIPNPGCTGGATLKQVSDRWVSAETAENVGGIAMYNYGSWITADYQNTMKDNVFDQSGSLTLKADLRIATQAGSKVVGGTQIASRASRATQVGSDGTLGYASQNLTENSDNPGSDSWSTTGTMTPNVLDSDGEYHACHVVLGNTNNINQVTGAHADGVSGERIEPSVWIKGVTSSGTFRLYNAATFLNGRWDIDFAALSGVWEFLDRDHAAVTVITEFTWHASNTGFGFYGLAADQEFYFYHPQLNFGTVAQTYTPNINTVGPHFGPRLGSHVYG